VRPLRIGISTCPNDTFAFHAVLTERVRAAGIEIEVELGDVQELNERLDRGSLDVAKVSFHAALLATDRWCMLPTGSALGFGVGPLLLAAEGRTTPAEALEDGTPPLVLCPGAGTTADLLFGFFHKGEGRIEQVVFSEVMPRLQKGEADFGVCIHEGRFTYETLGLRKVEDLGETWEQSTGLPLPLGGIAARRDLGDDVHRALTTMIGTSLDYALAHREETLPTMRRYAQELDDDVLRAHVDLYVNEWTRDLGVEGRAALTELDRRARSAGRVAQGAPPLVVSGATNT
jgi:1,4-dihydroxy-6-naphthoate synthase